ncbi:hypothetical protein MKX03_007421, partial [Papaver bracteatum]
MGIEENKDLLKGADWKNVCGDVTDASSVTIYRQVPEYYFLPRRPLSVILPFYGARIAAGIGTG